MVYFARGSRTEVLSESDLKEGLTAALEKIGKRRRVLVIPPDFTRAHSYAGPLTRMAYKYYGDALQAILPALGTHSAMSEQQIESMYGDLPRQLFQVHDWRNDVITVGEVPGDYLREVSEGRVDYSWPAQVNKLLVEGDFDLILSIGQVVPHEVAGMANYTKNIFVGTGGAEGINKSHFLGAVYGIERILGKVDNPVRRVLNYAADHFLRHLPIVYVLTVVSPDEEGRLVVRGLFIGDDDECYRQAAQLSLEVNFTVLDEALPRIVVYLDPDEFKSTWLGNKSVYRTRMAIADGGELIVMAPGLREFGEDKTIDVLIRKYGYLTSGEILRLTKENEDLQQNLSAAAHLIHGSSENRFRIIYCPGQLSREEIESVNYTYGDLEAMMKRYDPARLRDGFNVLPDGEKIYFISNPALGLWAAREKLHAQ